MFYALAFILGGLFALAVMWVIGRNAPEYEQIIAAREAEIKHYKDRLEKVREVLANAHKML
jgi:hypothetical protein